LVYKATVIDIKEAYMDIGYALLIIGLGLTLVFSGYRMARFIITLWGFITGVMFGGAIAADLTGMPFLGATVGVIVGIITGAILALLSYFFYSAAIIVLFGGLGYWLGSGLILFMSDSLNILAGIAGVGVGIAFGALAISFNMPKYVLIGVTAIAGAISTVGGLLLMTNQLEMNAFGQGAVYTLIDNSILWTLTALGLTVIGFIMQTLFTSSYALQEWTVDTEATPHNPPPTAHSPHH
jgi:hypothetical protein